MTIKVRDSVSGIFLAQMDVPIQVWHMIEIMRNNFNEQHMYQAPITENQLGTMRMMSQIAEQVGMDYPEVPDSRDVAKPLTISSFRGKKKDLRRT